MPKTSKSFSEMLGKAGGYILFCMMLLTVADVIGRYFFNSPIDGAYELTEIMMVTSVFLFIGYTQREKGHIAVDLVVVKLPKRMRIVIDISTHILSLLIFLLLALMNILRSVELMGRNEYTPIIKIPVAPFVLILAFGALAFCMELVKDIIRLFKHQEL
jgi:TRAP-type C4-dicarboxylate transport system permease small subunit